MIRTAYRIEHKPNIIPLCKRLLGKRCTCIARKTLRQLVNIKRLHRLNMAQASQHLRRQRPFLRQQAGINGKEKRYSAERYEQVPPVAVSKGQT